MSVSTGTIQDVLDYVLRRKKPTGVASSVTSGIPGSVSSFSEEYIVYVYFKSYIDLCAASSNTQKIMTKSI
jgi:hypothetical protein